MNLTMYQQTLDNLIALREEMRCGGYFDGPAASQIQCWADRVNTCVADLQEAIASLKAEDETVR